MSEGNLDAILTGFDGAMAVNLAPLGKAMPVVGVVFCVKNGLISSIAGYFGNPDAENQAAKLLGLNAAQVAAAALLALLPAGTPLVLIDQ